VNVLTCINSNRFEVNAFEDSQKIRVIYFEQSYIQS
jgi:non-homologous end joining protein Ku